MLNKLMLRQEYRSNDANIGRDFYERCLPLCSRFDRAVGFFASSVFSACPEAFRTFFGQRGRIRMVCSPIFDRSDIEAIVHGYRNRPQILRQSAMSILSQSPAAVLKDRGVLLSWLVASGGVDLRIALRQSSGRNDIYHEKLGIFRDTEDNCVVFAGSANESYGGLCANFESVDVFRSWVPDERRRIDHKRASFEKLWSNETDGLEVIPFFQAATRGVLRARMQSESGRESYVPPQPDTAEDIGPISGIEEVLLSPSDISLRDHQKLAVRKWFEARGRGILQMATGSGKTIAALAAAVKLYEWANAPMLIVVVCPYLHLCTQWIDECRQFGLDPLLCALSRSQWMESLSTRLFNLGSGSRRVGSVVVSNATFAGEAFQSLLRRAPQASLLIVDEVHNVGAADMRKALPSNFPFRIGLSATPERHHDPAGSDAIRQYFGEPVIKYNLRNALNDGVLCQYRYFPILVPLDDDELDAYLELTRRIAQMMAGGDVPGVSPYLESLLLQRTRILATCRNKIPALIKEIGPLRDSTHNLIYCGDGSVEDVPDAGIIRQIDAVVRALGRDLGMTVAKYVADTPLTRRHALRKRFEEGELQGLIAIRCLDEGVDIPEIRRAFILASSTNPRQFIQRRGRILRKTPGKSFADVFDFIVRPSYEESNPSSPIFPAVRNLFRRELHRITEFAQLAVNGPEAMHALLPIREALNLLDFGDDNDED